MLFQPAVIALLLVSGLSFAGLAAMAPASWSLLRHWDLASGSRQQIARERGTYLLSTLVRLVALVQIAALLLFVHNADRMADQFAGAMCAVGTLRANAWGFPALAIQVGLFFVAALWLIVDHADTRARNYPVVRFKHGMVLYAMLPLTLLGLVAELTYFTGLQPDVITSCCGSLFSRESDSVASDLVSLPLVSAVALFHGVLLAAIGLNLVHALRGRFGVAAGLASVLGFAAAITGIVSFVSLYVYEHPNHHCPFCMLQAEHGYLGYALYLPLFAATVAGAGVGLLGCFRGRRGLETVLPELSARCAGFAVASFGLFLAVSDGIVLTSRLTLIGSR